MSVASCETRNLLTGAPAEVKDQDWKRWCATHPELKRFDNVSEFHQAYLSSGIADKDCYLRMLVQLAAFDGGDDVIAAEWVAYLLRPGFLNLRSALADLPNAEATLMAAMWLEIRSFSWRRCRKVTSSIFRNVRTRALSDAGLSRRRAVVAREVSWEERQMDDRAIAALLTTPHHEQSALDISDPSIVLGMLLDWATDNSVISRDDRMVIEAGLAAAEALGDSVQSRARSGGLCSMEVSAVAGASVGMSGRAVRRATRRVLAVLTEAAPRFLAAA